VPRPITRLNKLLCVMATLRKGGFLGGAAAVRKARPLIARYGRNVCGVGQSARLRLTIEL
jgi:hypothetical protein